MLDSVILYVLYVLSVAYITKVLLIGHAGPFSLGVKVRWKVEDGDSSTFMEERTFDLFDSFRRLFGGYAQENSLLDSGKHIRTYRVDNKVWQCPFCLGFWITVFTYPVFVLLTASVAVQVLGFLAVPFVVGVINKVVS